MSKPAPTQPAASAANGDVPQALTRRRVFAGAGAAGAAAAAAALLPLQAVVPAAAVAQADAAADGYRVTEHVQRYYATARV